MPVHDVYLLALHEPYESLEHPVPIDATIVHALTLLHPQVPQPDGGLMYRCLTEFPSRTPGCLVPLATLTFELDGGRLWPEVGDWDVVVEAIVELSRRGLCDAVPLGLPELTSTLLGSGPYTKVTTYGPNGPVHVDPSERSRRLHDLNERVRGYAAADAFWPGDNLVAPPSLPQTMPYHPQGGAVTAHDSDPVPSGAISSVRARWGRRRR